jgi:CubicO group peptidase (beta-lactamase class C family)
MKSNHLTKCLAGFFLVWSINAYALPTDTTKALDRLLTDLSQRGQFNGSILVAINGKVIYRNGFGEANSALHQRFTPETLSCLASLSKQFTAMAIMMLAEQHRLNYDDPVTKYLPELTRYTNGITIRHLLTHTSGIPDVGDLGIDRPGLTNDDVLRTLAKQDSPPFKPATKYRYSNAGYVLLSMIVEKVSGQTFSAFLTEKILKPLRMSHTFLSDGTPHKLKPVAAGYSPFGKRSDYNGLTTGDSGMFSTVDDLLKWDQALYTEKLVRQSTLAEAFTPGKVKEGVSTYGFGWNISENEGQKFVWHTGNTGSYRAFIGRRLKGKITVIMLTNMGNSKRVEINDAILNIVDGKPYKLPKIPIAEKMYMAITKQGIEFAIRMYESLRATNDGTYDFGETELNSLGYELLSGDQKINDAIQIFTLNTAQYPTSSNAFDSLGDAYHKSGNKDLAIKNYEKALELDPTNPNARNMLRKLK